MARSSCACCISDGRFAGVAAAGVGLAGVVPAAAGGVLFAGCFAGTGRRSPEQTQRIKSALDISGSNTSTPAANAAAAGTGAANNEYSDDQLNTLIQKQKDQMFRQDGGPFSGMGKTPGEWREKLNNMTPEELRRFRIRARNEMGN